MWGMSYFFSWSLLFVFIVNGLSKTICTRRQYSYLNGEFYQRTQVSSEVACVERCVENADYCRAAIFIDHGTPQKPSSKRLCQLYDVNSESDSILLSLQSNAEPKIILFEIMDECPVGITDDDNMMDKIDASLTKALIQMLPTIDLNGKRTESAEFTVLDDINHHSSVSSKDTETEVSGKSFNVVPRNPFSSGSNGSAQHSSGDEHEPEPGSHGSAQHSSGDEHEREPDPVPIKPVAVSHAMLGRGLQLPCFGPHCFGQQPHFSPSQSNFYAIPPHQRPQPNFDFQLPCRAVHSTDPCAPRTQAVSDHATPHWSEWSPLGTCSVSCGQGARRRIRHCSTGNSSDCEGKSITEEPCNLPNCNEWSDWTSWELCSAPCGGGTQMRSRFCRLGTCTGSGEDIRSCNEAECPHWTGWSEWLECSTTCGPGVAKRVRECHPPSSYSCLGLSQDHKACQAAACPAWSEWLPWGECSRSCGGGEKVRLRTCDGGGCFGPSTDRAPCNIVTCPEWTPWSMWTPCSTTCGDEGTRLRTRMCFSEGIPSNLCPGTAQDQSACQLPSCPSWAEWTEWTPCSATCGHGRQVRDRKCEPGGLGCHGGGQELRFCQQAVCPYWQAWSEWSGCSVSCGRGSCERRRICVSNDPLPGAVLPDDEVLKTLDEQHDADNNNETSVRNDETTFQVSFSEDDRKATLKGQLIQRSAALNRSKLTSQILEVAQSDRRFAPSKNNNVDCAGSYVERKQCDAGPCCLWAMWASWSSCTSDCRKASGTRIRSRSCTVNAGSYSSNDGTSDFGPPNILFQTRHQMPINHPPPSSQNFPPPTASFAMDPRKENDLPLPIRPQVHFRGRRQAWVKSEQQYVHPPPFMSRPFVHSDPRCDCEGSTIETESCDTQPSTCMSSDPASCSWSEWSEWCGCSGNCQQAVRARTRVCLSGDRVRRCECPGDKVHLEDCVPASCKSDDRGHDLPVPIFIPTDEKTSTFHFKSTEVSQQYLRTDSKKQITVLDTPPPDTFIVPEITTSEAAVALDTTTHVSDFSAFDNETDDVTSCSWSDWSEWSACGTDFLQHRTRFCVGLKALINNCECKGSASQQTACRPDRDSHNMLPKNVTSSVTDGNEIEPVRIKTHRDDSANDTSTIQTTPMIQPSGQKYIPTGGHLDIAGDFPYPPLPATKIRAVSQGRLLSSVHIQTEPDNSTKASGSSSCQWSEWQAWSACDASTCGTEGERTRHRSCPCSSACGGGISTEIELCRMPSCKRKTPFDD